MLLVLLMLLLIAVLSLSVALVGRTLLTFGRSKVRTMLLLLLLLFLSLLLLLPPLLLLLLLLLLSDTAHFLSLQDIAVRSIPPLSIYLFHF